MQQKFWKVPVCAKKCIPFSLFAMMTLTACDSYWWSRGQPPGVSELFERSQSRLEESLHLREAQREKLAHSARSFEDALENLLGTTLRASAKPLPENAFDSIQSQWMNVEDQLSVGSRAAYAELSGQLRVFASTAKKGVAIDAPALELFAARSLFFLANELQVPAPA